MKGYHNPSPDILSKIYTDLFTTRFDACMFFMWYKFIHFPLPLKPAIYRTGKSPIILSQM